MLTSFRSGICHPQGVEVYIIECFLISVQPDDVQPRLFSQGLASVQFFNTRRIVSRETRSA